MKKELEFCTVHGSIDGSDLFAMQESNFILLVKKSSDGQVVRTQLSSKGAPTPACVIIACHANQKADSWAQTQTFGIEVCILKNNQNNVSAESYAL